MREYDNVQRSLAGEYCVQIRRLSGSGDRISWFGAVYQTTAALSDERFGRGSLAFWWRALPSIREPSDSCSLRNLVRR